MVGTTAPPATVRILRRNQPQGEPFNATPLGNAPAEPLPMKPTETEAPGARLCAQLGAAAVTVPPDCETVAFQPWVTVLPPGIVQVATHGLAAVAPVLVTVTVA